MCFFFLSWTDIWLIKRSDIKSWLPKVLEIFPQFATKMSTKMCFSSWLLFTVDSLSHQQSSALTWHVSHRVLSFQFRNWQHKPRCFTLYVTMTLAGSTVTGQITHYSTSLLVLWTYLPCYCYYFLSVYELNT